MSHNNVIHQLNPLLHLNIFHYNYRIWVLYLATYGRTQQFYKTQGCSKHEAAFFFKILKSFKAGSRLRTSKLYSTSIMLFTRLRAHAVPPTLRKRNAI